MIIRLVGNKEMEANQKLVFSLFMAAIQLIRESRLRPRLMDSIYNFMNIGIMISSVPMRHLNRNCTRKTNGNARLPSMGWFRERKRRGG